MKKNLLKKLTAGILSFAMIACVGFAATNISARATENEITATLPEFVERQMQEFSVTFNPESEGVYMVGVAVELTDKSTNQKIDLTNPESKNIVEVFYKEGSEWKPFVYEHFGPADGFPYNKATSEFKAQFKQAGSYNMSLTVYQIGGDDVATFGQDFTVAHDTIHVAAVAATADKVGNIEYWYDQYCDKYFKDAALTEEITYDDTIVPPIGETTNPDNPGDKPDKDPATPSNKPSGDKADNNASADKDAATKEPNSPKTADPMTLGLLFAAMGASGAGILGLKKRK